ncbi:MAG: hypothetical protein HXX80_02085 [Nitrososphaerales archaeon]|nr:hypothetical protein [Nitrososphaerales archaeon]
MLRIIYKGYGARTFLEGSNFDHKVLALLPFKTSKTYHQALWMGERMGATDIHKNFGSTYPKEGTRSPTLKEYPGHRNHELEQISLTI